ncbi:uncharacterized protein DEA37_0001994 [Paragonimus westermani]|uniref:Saposin B-type domain-containing protein n=1 Tax=Paragonimus westermani TaxID=34504 RepID=A0A5J4NW11_9TREM|nr:uncharacterized protein DEA37_0001994 [Paragonimus westermani]
MKSVLFFLCVLSFAIFVQSNRINSHSDLVCTTCQTIFTLMKAEFADDPTRATLSNQMITLCEKVPFIQLKDGCVEFVFEYLDAWFVALSNELDPLDACRVSRNEVTC